jgi:uncharacterized protein YoxC
MDLPFDFSALLQSAVIRDTIVTLTMPAQRTAFDYASGTLQILVLIVGLVALASMAAMTLTLRRAMISLQATVDRLAADAKPLLQQATRTSEDARDIVKTVRREVDRIAEATAEVSERLLDLSDLAEDRIDSVSALLDVMQDEVQDTAISAAATLRGARVGAVALGAVLGLRGRNNDDDASADEDDEELDDDLVDDDYDDEDDAEALYDLDVESAELGDAEVDDTSNTPKRNRS